MKQSYLFFIALLGIMFTSCSSGAAVTGKETPVPTETAKYYNNPIIATSLPDPTVIKANDGHFYLYATEDIRNTPIYRSDNLTDWTFMGTAFTDATRPTFVAGGGVWAPDINYINGKYVLYYAMSTWGGEWTCGIGAATADRPEGPFTDHGKLFNSTDIHVQNSIDEFFINDNNINYLFWGSFKGIYGTELTDDGLRLKDATHITRIAGDMMEGTYICKHGGYYYLFGSNGSCCDGLNSTYQVVYGRSENLFGPYVTREGKAMIDGDFDVLLRKNDAFVGPGHNAEFITDDSGNDWMIYHSYMASDPDAGRVLMLDQIHWDNEGWPYVENGSPSKHHKSPDFK